MNSLSCHNSLAIVVGDLSADNYVGVLASKLKQIMPNLNIFGVGGPKMEASGVNLIANCKELSVIGIFETLNLIPRLIKLRQQIIEQIAVLKPKLVLLVDFSGFNLILAKAIKQKFPNLPIYYFISPQIWGSRPWRINTIAQTIDKMFVIFPFEVDLYQSHNIPVKFVGHPLLTKIQNQHFSKTEFCTKYKLDPHKPIIAIFPGSRSLEIKNILPLLFSAISELSKTSTDIQFVLSKANDYLTEKINKIINESVAKESLLSKITFIDSSDNYCLFNACDLVWAKSGTTTLEAALFKKPMIIFYRGSWLSYIFYLLFRQTKLVGLPNILYSDYIIPELMQHKFSVKNIIDDTYDILNLTTVRTEMITNLESIVAKLGEGNYLDGLIPDIIAKYETLVS